MPKKVKKILRGRGKTVYILGAGAQGAVIADILRCAQPKSKLIFVDDNNALWGTSVLGIPVAGGLDFLWGRNLKGASVITAMGHPWARLRLAEEAARRGLQFVNAIHPSAVILPSAILGCDVVVGPQAMINTRAQVGDHVLVNSGVLIEHDCVLEEAATISPGVTFGGRVRVEKASFIGIGAVVLPRMCVGSGAVVAAGSVVTRTVPARTLVMGSPARAVRPVDENFDWKRLF